MLFVTPRRNRTPPRAVILGEKDLAVPPGTVELGGVVLILHAAQPQQTLIGTASKNGSGRSIVSAKSLFPAISVSPNP